MAERRRIAEADRQAQAAAVTWWVDDEEDEDELPRSRVVLVLRNSSNALIYDARVFPMLKEFRSLEIGIVPPNREERIVLDYFTAHADGFLVVEFMDAAGQRWQRLQDGALARIGESRIARFKAQRRRERLRRLLRLPDQG